MRSSSAAAAALSSLKSQLSDNVIPSASEGPRLTGTGHTSWFAHSNPFERSLTVCAVRDDSPLFGKRIFIRENYC
ncbi:MAG: hypothetical protein DME47_03855 [Verrucomicrobia bacterium]|nr:MAG: hypothetical protein DME47_03855 [Verrucomicrobiota bacterium]